MISQNYKRENVLWLASIPQIVLLSISIVWIILSPKDNLLNYLLFDIKYLLVGIFVGSLLALAGYLTYYFAKKINKLSMVCELFEEVLSPIFKNIRNIDIIALSIASGFCEEIFFRGLLQMKVGIVLASLAFGMLHFPGAKYWFYTIWATLSGVLLGLLFIYTGSLWVPITAHSVNNIIGMLLLKQLKK